MPAGTPPPPDPSRPAGGAGPGGAIVVAEPAGLVVLVWLLFPVLGAALLWLVRSSAGWVAALRWMPMRGPFRLIDAVDEPWATGGALLLGALGGLLVAAVAAAERLTVTVAGEGVTLVRDDVTRRIARDGITGAFRDGSRLVLLGPAAEELVRESSDLPADRLRAAFEAYGYRWYADGDPFRAEYRRWTDGGPDLPPGANPLLRARQRALDRNDRADAVELRTELARLGVVVREEGRRQYWRRAGQGRTV
ncbi:YqeB family protein [Plantactinospora sp. WMMB334]|uniref:YqeB family protein n=1 Tax=Plantactinospora sp. WMMB334 TaxID=3404119 RepID=UPI003B94C610